MKDLPIVTAISACLLLLISLRGIASSNKLSNTKKDDVNLQVFYDALSPYGQWVEEAENQYIWIPDVAPGWRPYLDEGYWANTNAGWVWASSYDWGWAPFHYGRWRWDDFYNSWVWIPDYEWSPAWVLWRQDADNFGWAPLEPGEDPLELASVASVERWVFVARAHFCDPDIRQYSLDQPQITRIFPDTKIIENIKEEDDHDFVPGPHVGDVEKASGTKVPLLSLQEADQPGTIEVKDNEIYLYQPDIEIPENGGGHPVPKKFIPKEKKIQAVRRQTPGMQKKMPPHG